MRKAWGKTFAHLATMGAMLVALCGSPVSAQRSDDAAGRELFEEGRTAFDRADYETALIYFRRAYELSLRGELQYNIGIAAARLQREEEAVEAFYRYLEEASEPEREAEVRQRIEALETSIAEREATARALEEAALRYEQSVAEPVDGKRLPSSTIIGASTLAAVGVAGVVAMGVGVAKDGRCKSEIAGRCVVEHSATAWTWVYGGVGVAALAASAAWFAVSAKRARSKREARVVVGPAGLVVSGKF